jgi:hypothetical protein
MSNHEVEVTKISERVTPYGEIGSTIGSIVVKPPITPGVLFDTAIRGRDGYGVNFAHVVTTSEATLFVAGSNLKEAEQRQGVIYTIADRIKRLANAPEKVVDLLDDNPFPTPAKK